MEPSAGNLDRLRWARRLAWAAQITLFCFLLCTPFDNLLEVPHGIFRLLRGDGSPFDTWTSPFQPLKPPLDVALIPRTTALEHWPFTGSARFLLIAVFLAFQWEFVRLSRGRAAAWSRRLLIPGAIFGLYFGSLVGTWYLTVLDFAGRLQEADRSILVTFRAGGWKAFLLGSWFERLTGIPADLNRPWVYVAIFVIGLTAFASAIRLFRRRSPSAASRTLITWLASASAISIFVAGPVDIAARTSEPANFLTGTFVSLLIAMPMFLWSLWPLTEAFLTPGVPWPRFYARAWESATPITVDAGSYVARAHTMSLALLALGLAGWQIGLLHSNRTRLMTEARELIAVELLRNSGLTSRFDPFMKPGGNYLQQRRERTSRRVDPTGEMFTVEDLLVNGFPHQLSLGSVWNENRIESVRVFNGGIDVLLARQLPVIGNVRPYGVMTCSREGECRAGYLATVSAEAEGGRDFFTGIFRLDDPSPRRRLQEIGRELDLPPDALPDVVDANGKIQTSKWEVWMERIYRRLYNWSVNVPLVEGLSTSTTVAIWAIALVSCCALTVLRNCLIIALRATGAVTGEPWLLLDADLPFERLIAAVWLAAIPLSGAMVSSALLVASSETFRISGAAASPFQIAVTLGGILTLTAINAWTAASSVSAIVALRRRRVAALLGDKP